MGDEVVHIFFALFRSLPSIRPEAKVHGPPVVRTSGGGNCRHQVFEIEVAFAERRVGAGVVVVQRIVRVDQVNAADFALQFLGQFPRAAG